MRFESCFSSPNSDYLDPVFMLIKLLVIDLSLSRRREAESEVLKIKEKLL